VRKKVLMEKITEERRGMMEDGEELKKIELEMAEREYRKTQGGV